MKFQLLVILLVLTTINSLLVLNKFHKSSSRLSFTTRAVKDITSASGLDEILSSSKDSIVVIDYSTTWCGPCKMVAPKYELLSENEKYKDVVFLKCIGDIAPEGSALMKREGIRSVPAFHIWKSGKRVEVINGARIDEVEAAIVAAK